ncbi:MAG: HupE/UreJ family protein [Thiotrichaceae bacterium]|nr:HupE/UreJ family protein [Thiotrichaceae bacterium]
MLIRLLLLLFLLPTLVTADMVKPALIEINVNAKGQVDIEVRASIEALLTGINGRYKNTKQSPNADQYDALRVLQSEALLIKFDPFKTSFLATINLSDQLGQFIALSVVNVKIPERGYTKVPRISTIYLQGKIPSTTKSLQWYYPLSFGDHAVRLRQIDKMKETWHWSEWQWLRKDKTSEPFLLNQIEIKRPWYQVALNYIVTGFEHIIPKGLDHILFILALFFFKPQLRILLWQVSLFTLAHTVTLGLSSYGLIHLPAIIIEPLIALSIAYAALENLFNRGLKRSRMVLIFAFGLLHGLGFASVLADFGLPETDFLLALLSFNIGVELAQVGILLCAYFCFAALFKDKPWYQSRVTIPASLLIAVTGIILTVQRIQLG